MNAYYPAFLDLRDKSCLVVGTGGLSDEKAASLNRAGARVKRAVRFDPEDARDVFLIVADVEEREAAAIRDFGDTRKIFVNLVDNPALDQGGQPGQTWGYAVFGRVVDGMGVVDEIAQVRTGQKAGMGDVPVEPVLILRAYRDEN
ncbi:MAG: peptidylprolyl isomerase [Gemmatimonadota bacterium]